MDGGVWREPATCTDASRHGGEPPPGGDSVPGRAVVLKYAHCHQPPRRAGGRGARVTGSSCWGLNRAAARRRLESRGGGAKGRGYAVLLVCL